MSDSDRGHGGRTSFPKLKSSKNYRPWSRSMKNRLLYKDCLEVVFGERDFEPPPDVNEIDAEGNTVLVNGVPSYVINPDVLLWSTYETKLAAWKNKERLSRALIIDKCNITVANLVEHVDDGKHM